MSQIMSGAAALSLSKAELSALLPHTGAMCLLDSVLSWTRDEIICLASSHRNVDHPLRRDGVLPAVSGVEYAAQAIGVHGRLVSGQHVKPVAGFLVSLRELRLYADRLDDIARPIAIHARRLADNLDTVMCEFDVCADGRTLITGRAALLLEAR